MNYPRYVYHRALIRYYMRLALWRLVTITSLIIGKDQGSSADVEVQMTNKKAEMFNCVKD